MNILSDYIQQVLIPTHNETEYLRSKFRAVKAVLEHNAGDLSLAETRLGGSFSRSTMLRYNAEIDVVAVLKRSAHKGKSFDQVLESVFQALKDNFPAARIKRGNKLAVGIKFKSEDGRSYGVDVVPTFPVSSPRQFSETRRKRPYQGYTTVWHEQYLAAVAMSHADFPNATRLLKDWNNETGTPLKSYELELLAACAVEFRVDEKAGLQAVVDGCFRELIGFVDGAKCYPVDWPDFDPDTDLEMFDDKVVLVDPADPLTNAAARFSEGDLATLRSEAHRAVTLLRDRRYAEVFDPRRTDRGFWDAHRISA